MPDVESGSILDTVGKKLYRFSDEIQLLLPDNTDMDPNSLNGILWEVLDRNDYLGHPFVQLARPTRDQVILDIGGHVGAFSVLAAKRFPDTRIIAFEPLPVNFELLRENLRLNDVAEQVSVWPVAVTQSAGERQFYASGRNSGLNSLYPLDESAAPHALTVEAIALNEFLDSQGLREIFLLKLDCEGGEYEILYGADEAWLRHVSLVVLEYHSMDTQPCYNAQALKEFLEARGFLCDESLYPGASMIYAVRAELVSKPVREVIRAYLALSERVRQEFLTVLNEKKTAFDCLHKDRVEAQRIMETQSAELGQIRGAMEALRADRAKAQEIMDEQQSALEQMRHEKEALRADRAKAQEIMERQALELDQVRDAAAKLRTECLDFHERAEHLARVLAEIQATRGWRALMYLRGIRERLKSALRARR